MEDNVRQPDESYSSILVPAVDLDSDEIEDKIMFDIIAAREDGDEEYAAILELSRKEYIQKKREEKYNKQIQFLKKQTEQEEQELEMKRKIQEEVNLKRKKEELLIREKDWRDILRRISLDTEMFNIKTIIQKYVSSGDTVKVTYDEYVDYIKKIKDTSWVDKFEDIIEIHY